MPATYEPIATTTLSSAQATATFSSIPATYTDLILVFSGSIDTSGRTIRLRFNSDSGTNYSDTYVSGDGTTATSSRTTSQASARISLGLTSSTQTVITSHIQNYSNSTTYKTLLSRGTSASDSANAIVSLWRSTSAITDIEVRLNSTGNFNSDSTFTLYGIKAA